MRNRWGRRKKKRNHSVRGHIMSKIIKGPIYLLLNIKMIYKKNLKYNVL
jgi:hypothetical protein